MVNSRNWQVPNHEVHEFAGKNSRYCLCIPVINEGKRFQQQLTKIRPYARDVDILILDGGSKDGSIETNFLKKNGVRTLLIKTGPGKLSAQLRMGYAYALKQGYEGIITVDGNGKDGYEAIPRFIKELEKGFDYVQGSRFIKGGLAINTPLLRHFANRYIHAPLISIAAHSTFTDTTNGFRGYSRKYLLDDRVKPFRDIFVRYELLAYLSIRASQIGYKVREIPVIRKYPKGEVPTKIGFIGGNIDLLKTLVSAVLGRFTPRK